MNGEFIRDHARIPCENSAPPRVTQLALRAARESLASAQWNRTGLEDDATALVVGTSKGPIEEWREKPGADGSIGLHEVAETLTHELNLGAGPRVTLSAACASGLHALIHATMLLRSGVARRALVVAAEASVNPLFVASFKRLGVLPPEGFGCRPFDLDRAGFLMSEAAAAVCLEASEFPARRDSVRVDRFSLGADATHLTGLDPAGKTLRRLLARVMDNRPVDLIHAHGTGTGMNDPIELAATEHLLPTCDRPAFLYSHKGALGHSLGAAGLVSIVLNAESHRRGIVLPNVQTRRPLPTMRVRLVREPVYTPIRRSVAIAAGFGGASAVVSCTSD